MTDISIRKSIKSDCKQIRDLIQELADYENMPDGPKINSESKVLLNVIFLLINKSKSISYFSSGIRWIF